MSKNLVCLAVAFFLMSCATPRPPEKVSERITVQVESSERVDGLIDKMRALEDSITHLRAEIINLERQLKATQARPPLHSFKLPKEVMLCGERIPVEDRNVWENLDREFLASVNNEALVLLWIKRSWRYFPHIERKLKERGLPDDLKYVAITESSLRPHAVSSSGASGIWQFIPSTGERYGMRKNRAIDERFDFFKATEGALAYLKSLYEEFGNWALAMAAYNAGENRVRKEIELQETKDYYHLALPMETERYVYKIAVAKIILSNPWQYGFILEEKQGYGPLEVERVQIELTRPLPLLEVAKATGFFYREIRDLNPHFLENSIPSGIHFLNLPPGASKSFWNFIADWKKGLEPK